MLRGVLVIAAAVSLLPSCGGECGEGTVRYGDTCLAVDPFDKTAPNVSVSPGLYTREVGTVRMEADEPATIYYTIDGTSPTLDSPHEADTVVIPNVPDNAQLRYFAVDLNGNQGPEQVRLWIIDREGPSPPLDFGLNVAGSTRTAIWTAPPDPRFGGVLLARVEGQVTSPPVSGKQYAVGDELSPGVTVVQIDGPDILNSNFTETLPTRPGLVRYVAWAFDDLYNYGGGAGEYIVVPMPAQPATATADASNNTFNISSQPPNVTLSGAASFAGTTLTVEVAMRNDTTRVLFAPKIVLTSALPSGVTLSNQSGLIDTTLPYRAYGAAIAPGGTVTQTWTFAGATSATQIAMSLDVRNNPVLYATFWDSAGNQDGGGLVDEVTGLEVLRLKGQISGQGGEGMTHHGGITADGRMVAGARNVGGTAVYDLVTGDQVLSAEYRPQKAQAPYVSLDASGTTAYALVADGHPQNLQNNGNGSSKTELIRLDAASLAETARLDLGVTRAKSMDLSPDEKTLLIATGVVSQGVVVVDLATFTITRRIMTDFRPQVALFVPGAIEGSNQIAIVGERVALYSLDGTLAQTFETPGTNGKVLRAVFVTPTQLWIGRRSELARLDTSDGTTTLYPTQGGRFLEFHGGKIYAGNSNIQRIATDGTVELNPIPGFTNVDGHWIGRSPF